MTNIKIGSACENLVAKILRENGYWVYITPLKTSGQPMDIIAAKKHYFIILDAKHVRENEPSFKLSRIEPNQEAVMDYCRNFAHLENIGFAILFERTQEVYWLSYDRVLALKEQGAKSVNLRFLPTFKETLAEIEKEDK